VNLDGGLEAARRTVLGIYGDLPARLAAGESGANPKGRLQEIVQPVHGNKALSYDVLATEGADHERRYEVAVCLLGRRIGSGRGPSKKVAEEEAARAALAALAADPPSK
jgi:ribonuclease-3